MSAAPPEPALPAPAAAVPAAPTPPATWLSKLQRLKGPIAAIAGVGAVLSGLVGWYTTFNAVKTAATAPAAPASSAAARAPLAVMVLPFANQTGDPTKTYIADGLTSSLTADLSRIREATVVPETTAAKYRDAKLSVQQIGNEAGAGFLLTGSVRADADKLRIQVQLNNTVTGKQEWNDTFEGQATNLFALLDQVTVRTSNTVAPEMLLAAARDAAKRPHSATVADLMLRQAALGWQQPTLANYRERESLLRQVLKQEPDNTEAMSLLANVLSTLVANQHHQLSEQQLRELREESGRLALKVRELDPSNPRIYTVLSRYYTRQGDRAQAEAALLHGLELSPKSPGPYNELGLYYNTSDPKKAIAYLEQGLALSPKRSNMLVLNLSTAHFALGDYPKAIAYAQRCAELMPTFAYCWEAKAWSYALMGDKDNAAKAAQELLRVEPGYRTSKANLVQPHWTPAEMEVHNRMMQAAKLAGLPE